jgi:hypothetical protein
MPQTIPIQALPNQEFTVVLDSNTWDFTIRETNAVMSVTLVLNGTTDIENLRAVAGMRVIPSQYEEAGNFIFSTQNYALPDYTQFGISQNLLYYSAMELAAIRVPTPVPITAAWFNPIAALPLRFQPIGYTA